MDAEEAEDISGSDKEVNFSSNSSFEANIGAAVIDILPPAGDVDHLSMDCSVNDTAAAVEPSNISTASTQHVAFSEDAATEAGEGRLSSEDVRMFAGLQVNNMHAEQDEKEAVSVEPPVVLDDGHAVEEKYNADDSLSESIAHGEAGIEPPTTPPTVAIHEEDTEQREKPGNGAPSSTEEGPSDDLRKVGATCGATW